MFFDQLMNLFLVCVQSPNETEPTWLTGNASISRSPVVHPGDGMPLILGGYEYGLTSHSVQRVRAIGKPPDDKLCLFRNLVNVVVLPSVGMSISKQSPSPGRLNEI